MDGVKELIERIEGAEGIEPIDIERDIRIAVWNTCRWQGRPQEVAQSFIRHVMAEPTMVRAMAAIDELAAAALKARAQRGE